VPKSIWAEAFSTAVYILNLFPNKLGNGGLSPQEAFTVKEMGVGRSGMGGRGSSIDRDRGRMSIEIGHEQTVKSDRENPHRSVPWVSAIATGPDRKINM
jgi:hypothetical protein